MIVKLTLKDYRCYEEHVILFKPISIIVGKNNAGKSTLIEALRLISLVASRIKTSIFKQPPDWANLSKNNVGIAPSLDRIEFSIKNVIHQYGDPPAIIIAEFENKEVLEIRLNNEGKIFALGKNSKGEIIKSRAEAKLLKSVRISILPQISPLLEEEKGLDEAYVKANVFSALTSRHFRNQLSYFYDKFKEFKEVAENSWDGLRIVQLIKAEKKFHIINPILLVQEGGFVTEIGSMGHGLQMWLQTMWFIARTTSRSSIVLDEPDVYMHADLQRKLIRMLIGNFNQIIIATHSLEIMAEVDAENILIIDRRKSKSNFATDIPEIQKIIYNDIGSIHNLELAKLWSARKFLMVEGDDIQMLKRMYDRVIPESNNPIDGIPNSDIGGWGGWKYAIGSKFVLKNAGDETIMIYCLLDSDYHLPPEKEIRLKEAKKNEINLHIWTKKEIENYLIISDAILRICLRKQTKLKGILTKEIIDNKIDEICEQFKDEVIDDFASEIGKYFRNKGKIIDFTNEDKEVNYEIKNINKIARKHVDNNWHRKISIVPGKKLIKEINKWLTESYKTNIGTLELSRELKLEEIDGEVKYILNQIDKIQELNYMA